MSTNRLQDKILQLHLHGSSIYDWMDILVIAISLDQIYHPSADGQDPQTIEKWQERVVLPEVLMALALFCMEKGLKNFDSFSNACNALPDPSLAIAFTPVNQPCLYLSPAMLHCHLDVACALETSMPDEAYCILGVCFVGVMAQQLEVLLQNVQPPFSDV